MNTLAASALPKFKLQHEIAINYTCPPDTRYPEIFLLKKNATPDIRQEWRLFRQTGGNSDYLPVISDYAYRNSKDTLLCYLTFSSEELSSLPV